MGEHAAHIDNLNDRITRIEDKVDMIQQTLSEAKGGWRVLMLMGGAAGVVGGFLSKYIGKVLP